MAQQNYGSTHVNADHIRVYLDTNEDGQFNYGEAFRVIAIPLSTPVNYVALGDSYSAGENGGTADGHFEGNYLLTHAAGEYCNRWDRAYPFNVDGELARFAITTDTYACTGAITLNIHDPGRSSTTNRPAPSAPVFVPSSHPILVPDLESRQSASLANAAIGQDIDMVTLTIGGNDVDFAAELAECFSPSGRCYKSDDEIRAIVDSAGARVESVLSHLKGLNLHSGAGSPTSIFILGYPYLTADRNKSCDALTLDRMLGEIDLNDIRNGTINRLLGLPLDQASPAYSLLPHLPDGLTIANALSVVAIAVLPLLAPFDVDGVAEIRRLTKIDGGEREFIRFAGGVLNDRIRSAAAAVGVHYVEVARPDRSTRGSASFDGHDSCNEHAPWLNGLEGRWLLASLRTYLDSGSPTAVLSGRSFHPTEQGHRAYAAILGQYISNRITEGAPVTAAGLPANPAPAPRSASARSSDSRSSVNKAPSGGSGADESPERRSGASAEDEAGSETAPVGLLLPLRAGVPALECTAPFVRPGERISFFGGGFAADSSVSLSAFGATLAGAALPAITIPGVTADSAGSILAQWTIPQAPGTAVDPAPRVYGVVATGTSRAGQPFSAQPLQLLLAYPGDPPCAVDDSVTTPLGASILVSPLANDTAPGGGSLDAGTLAVDPVDGGAFAVNSAEGTVTFTPDAGFAGTVTTGYTVKDNWGIGAGAEITVTVDAGCTITGTVGETRIEGTDSDDVMCVPDPSDDRAFHVIDAKGGNDVILGGAGIDWVHAGPGDDVIYGRGGDDSILGGPGMDTVHGGPGFDTVAGTDLADAIVDDPGGYELILIPADVPRNFDPVANDDARIVGLAETLVIEVLDNDHDPNDDLDASTLAVSAVPSLGTALVTASAEYGYAVSYTAGSTDGHDTFNYEICDSQGGCATARVDVTVGAGSCTIMGTESSETLRGTPGDDVICGLGGDDVILGLGGDDTIIGGEGDDTLYGGDETLIGSDGRDTLHGGGGDDTLYGGGESDTLWGGPGDDTLAGNRGTDTVHGGDGDDTINGGGEDDTVFAGPGADDVLGHAGNDTLHGSGGDDTLRGGNGDDTIWGGSGVDTITGGAGDDTLYGGADDDTLWGDTQNDTLYGGPGDDTLHGRGHEDVLYGGDGNDILNAGAGDDEARGEGGDDTLDGGNGDDYLDGGDDTDTCRRGDVVSRCE